MRYGRGAQECGHMYADQALVSVDALPPWKGHQTHRDTSISGQ